MLVAPPWILAGKPHDQLLHLFGYRRVGPWIWMGRSSAGPPCAGASAAASRVAPGTATTAPVGAGGSAPQAAPGPSGACGAVDAGGVAPRARGAIPGSRSRWPPPSGSRAGPARGCGAAPGRRTTRPHETSIGEGERATAHRSPSSNSTCWSRPRSTSDTPRPIGLVQHHPARWPLLFGGRLGQADSAHCGMPWKNDTPVRAPGPWRRPLPTGCRPTALRIASTVTSAPLQAEGPRVSGDGPPFASRLGGILIRDWSSLSLGPRSDSLRDPVTPNSPLSRTGTASGRGLQ